MMRLGRRTKKRYYSSLTSFSNLTKGQVYYISHIDNIPLILEKGLLSHNSMFAQGIDYNESVVSRRKDILSPDGVSLWNYANFYLQPRNPMLYQLLHQQQSKHHLCILRIDTSTLPIKGAFYTNGNAANIQTVIKQLTDITLDDIIRIRKNVEKEWWSDLDDSKRTIMAKILIPNKVSLSNIAGCYVPPGSPLLQAPLPRTLYLHENPKIFFSNSLVSQLTPNITLVQGDMFFSSMDTLVVTVNCVGVMGKGLAATCKYRFPDAYVVYQDFCKEKKLRPGVPALYKRNMKLDKQLALNLDSLPKVNSKKWFLFIPTKNHWKENSDINMIEKSLHWLLENYNKERITSIVLPALGCGLGNLKWEHVGPVMCKYLSKMNIKTEIYLPAEAGIEIEKKYLTKEFLL